MIERYDAADDDQDLEWNNSKLSCLQQCAEKYRRRYLVKDRFPSSPRQIRGTTVHRIATDALMRKLKGFELPTVAEARDLAATAFDHEWRNGVLLTEDEAGLSKDYVEGVTKDFAVDLSAFHVERVAPEITPVGVERKIIVKPRDSDITIHGTIDLIDATPDGEVIRDLKTREKSPNKNEAETSQQLTMYATIRLAEVGTLPHELALDVLVRTPARFDKKRVTLTTTRDMEDVGTIVHRINTAVEAVKRGVFVPTNPDNWWCSPTWCEFYTTCPYVRRGSRPRN